MTPLDMVLHREAILAQITFLTAFQEQLENARKGCGGLPDVSIPKRLPSIHEDDLKPLEKKTITKGLCF